MGITKSINPGQPVQSAQADQGQNHLLLADFLCINPFLNKPWILHVCSTSLLKMLREKEKLLVTSNFSFSHSVFYHFGQLSAIQIKLKIVVCKFFQFGRVQNLSFGKRLSDNSTLLNCHFEIIKQYQPVLALFPFLAVCKTRCHSSQV